MKSKKKEQWLDLALQQLVNNGPESLKIVPLCDALGVTKGSFYHHFKSRSDFIEALMLYWYQKATLNFIEQENTKEGALERLNKLDQVIAANDIEAEMHLRAWALKEASIGVHLEKIDDRRQQYLIACFKELGMAPEMAVDVAMIAYAQLLGLLQLRPKPSMETILRLSGLASSRFFESLS